MSAGRAFAKPLIQPMRIMLWVAALLVFVVGLSLFVLTEQTDRYFAWTIKSALTAAFLGGAYWASFVLEVTAGRERWWANARPAVPAVIVFTALTLVVTLVHVDRFHFGAPELFTRVGTWFWLAIYAFVPVIMTVFALRQRAEPGDDPPIRVPLPSWMRIILAVNGVILLLIGLALLLVPETMATIWPWPLTALTGRAIGAWFVGLALASAHVAYENDLRRGRTVSISSVVFVALQAIALARYAAEFQWSSVAGIAYLAGLADFLIVGLVGALQSRAAQDAA